MRSNCFDSSGGCLNAEKIVAAGRRCLFYHPPSPTVCAAKGLAAQRFLEAAEQFGEPLEYKGVPLSDLTLVDRRLGRLEIYMYCTDSKCGGGKKAALSTRFTPPSGNSELCTLLPEQFADVRACLTGAL